GIDEVAAVRRALDVVAVDVHRPDGCRIGSGAAERKIAAAAGEVYLFPAVGQRFRWRELVGGGGWAHSGGQREGSRQCDEREKPTTLHCIPFYFVCLPGALPSAQMDSEGPTGLN